MAILLAPPCWPQPGLPIAVRSTRCGCRAEVCRNTVRIRRSSSMPRARLVPSIPLGPGAAHECSGAWCLGPLGCTRANSSPSPVVEAPGCAPRRHSRLRPVECSSCRRQALGTERTHVLTPGARSPGVSSWVAHGWGQRRPPPRAWGNPACAAFSNLLAEVQRCRIAVALRCAKGKDACGGRLEWQESLRRN